MLISVPHGDVLTVTADHPGSYGTVWRDDHAGQWTVSAKSPLHLGPGRYRIETVRGNIRHTVSSRAVAALNATLPRATEIIHDAANIAQAINGKNTMLQDKFKRLAERAKAVPAALSDRADKSLARLDAVEARSVVFDKLDAIATDAEQGVAAAEDAVNQLTNSGVTGCN